MARGFLSDDAPRKSDLIDLDVRIEATTAKAVLVKNDKTKQAVWLPKSQCELELKTKGMGTLTVPEWLAQDRGLI